MAQRYDAIVVDCENEQNASLLFKSARIPAQSEFAGPRFGRRTSGRGQGYRIGANLVLTKPFNVEQAKGSSASPADSAEKF